MAVIFRGKRYSGYKEVAEELFENNEIMNMVDDDCRGWEIVQKGNTLQLIRYEGVAPMAWAGPYRGTCPLRKRIVAEKEVA